MGHLKADFVSPQIKTKTKNTWVFKALFKKTDQQLRFFNQVSALLISESKSVNDYVRRCEELSHPPVEFLLLPPWEKQEALTGWAHWDIAEWTCPCLDLQQKKNRRHPSSYLGQQRGWSLPPGTQGTKALWLTGSYGVPPAPSAPVTGAYQKRTAFQPNHDVSQFWDRGGAQTHVRHVFFKLQGRREKISLEKLQASWRFFHIFKRCSCSRACRCQRLSRWGG